MDAILKVRSQCKVLLKLHEQLTDLFGGRKGTVQFFRHKDQHSVFVVQIRRGHLVDVGRLMMGLSFEIKGQYDVFQGIAMREQLHMPERGFPDSKNYEYAFKHVFLRFEFHPRLQEMLFASTCLKPNEVYQDIARIPYIVEDVVAHLPGAEPKSKE